MKLAIRTWEDHSHSHEEHHLDQSPHPDEGVVPAYAGSTARSAASLAARAGSSPHTRGALPRRPLTARLPQDHPRIRGEHLVVGDGALLREGIIPAYAGSTVIRVLTSELATGSSPHTHTRGARSTWAATAATRGDHPRIRGEHRGQPHQRGPRDRIIPAYAGSTRYQLSMALSAMGSSPHTRGAPSNGPRIRSAISDHPRIRGEHSHSTCSSLLLSVDHPRIRGEHVRTPMAQIQCSGIIPAYAGSTRKRDNGLVLTTGSSPHTRGAPRARGVRHRPHRDHPRIRGEHLQRRGGQRQLRGIIPAYAGSTSGSATTAIRAEGSSPHTRGALIGLVQARI